MEPGSLCTCIFSCQQVPCKGWQAFFFKTPTKGFTSLTQGASMLGTSILCNVDNVFSLCHIHMVGHIIFFNQSLSHTKAFY